MERHASNDATGARETPFHAGPGETMDIGKRLSLVDWQKLSEDLDNVGYAVLPALLARSHCEMVRDLFDEADLFRSQIVMERYNFGQGEYKYFNYPLPDAVSELRILIYPHLVPVANRWHAAMKIGYSFP